MFAILCPHCILTRILLKSPMSGKSTLFLIRCIVLLSSTQRPGALKIGHILTRLSFDTIKK